MIYSVERYNALVDETFAEIKKLAALKGGEYAGDVDRLANFRRNGEALGLPMETVWAVYSAKHWDAIMQYVRDIKDGKTRERLEGIEGRIDDLIVYLLLFKSMVDERTTPTKDSDQIRKMVNNPKWEKYKPGLLYPNHYIYDVEYEKTGFAYSLLGSEIAWHCVLQYRIMQK